MLIFYRFQLLDHHKFSLRNLNPKVRGEFHQEIKGDNLFKLAACATAFPCVSKDVDWANKGALEGFHVCKVIRVQGMYESKLFTNSILFLCVIVIFSSNLTNAHNEFRLYFVVFNKFHLLVCRRLFHITFSSTEYLTSVERVIHFI